MSKKRSKQFKLFDDAPREYGGALRTTRAGRTARPLSAKQTIHLTLRSTKATGARSFRRHRHKVEGILKKHAAKTGIRLIHWANAYNHLHLHIKLPNHAWHRREYKRFIRAITGLIAREALGAEKSAAKLRRGERFWDLRPYTRVLSSWGEYLRLKDYIHVNHLEGLGIERALAREMVRPSILVESG